MALESELKIVISTVDQSSPNIKKIELGINGLIKTVTGMYALKQVFGFFADSIKKVADEEKNLRTLQTVIENQGTAWDSVKTRVEEYLKSMERNTLYTDTQIIPSFKQLINAGMNTAQAMRALNTVTDLATAKGLDLETAANLIGKAYMGNVEQLKRYGIQATDFNGLMDEINKKFGKSAQKDMETYAGNVKKLEQTIEDNQKMIGNYWIPKLTAASKWLDKLFGIDNTPAKNPRVEQLTNQIANLEGKLKDIRATAEYGPETVIKVFGRDAVLTAAQIQNIGKIIVGWKKELKDIQNPAPFIGPLNKNESPDYTPEPPRKEQEQWEKEYKQSLMRQYAAVVEVRDQTDQIMMSSYDYEINLIDQKAKAYEELGVWEVDINKWVSAQKIAALDKELKLHQTTDKIVQTLAVGTAEERKYLIADILEEEMLAQSKKFAWMAVEKLLLGDLAGAAIAGAEALALGYGASLIHASTEADKAKNKAEADARNATANAAVTTTSGIVTSSGGNYSTPTGITSSPSPTYNYINNTYNLNAGIMMGDETTIDAAFKKVMTRYDAQMALTLSGA